MGSLLALGDKAGWWGRREERASSHWVVGGVEGLVSLALALRLILSKMGFGRCWPGRAGAPVHVQDPSGAVVPLQSQTSEAGGLGA